MVFEPEGTLIIDFIRNSYLPGEAVKGRIRLNLDKPIKARRLLISLIGEEWIDVSCGSGKNRTSKSEEVEIHREDIELSGEGMYSAVEKTFEFRIPEDAPPTIWMHPSDPSAGTMKQKGWGFKYSLSVFSLSIGPGSRGAGFRWIVHAKMDIPWGIDKNTREEIFVY